MINLIFIMFTPVDTKAVIIKLKCFPIYKGDVDEKNN